MAAQAVTPTKTGLRRTIRRPGWWIVIGLLATLIGLAGAAAASLPPLEPREQARVEAPPMDAAARSIMGYLEAHSALRPSAQPAAPLSPAEQSVMNYLRAHGVTEPQPTITPLDQAAKAVLDYLRSHR